MKAAHQLAILNSIALTTLLGITFGGAMHIPGLWQLVMAGIALSCFVLMFLVNRKAKKDQAGKPTQPIRPDRRKLIFWMAAAPMALGFLTSLPLMPYTVENFQPWIYWVVVPSMILFIAIFLTWYWQKLGSMKVPKRDEDRLN